MQVSDRVAFAHNLRGFAALCVVISHYYVNFWSIRDAVSALTYTPELPLSSFATPKYISWLNWVPSFNWGAYGVALFFLISGFVIPFSLKKTSFLVFFVNRIIRILPTYIVGFSLTLMSIWVGLKYFSGGWPFTLNEIFIHYIPGIRDVLWSKNIDGVIWTLEIEMKFYLICTIFIFLFHSCSRKVFLIPVMLFVVSIILINRASTPENMLSTLSAKAYTFTFVSQFIVFMFIGVVFNYLYVKRLSLGLAVSIILGLFVLFAIFWRVGVFKQTFLQVWSYGFALFSFSSAYVFRNKFKGAKIFVFFADISYPLYVSHEVFGYITMRIFLDLGMKAWVSLVITTLTAICISWIIHAFIESPSQIIGKSLVSQLALHKKYLL